MNIYEGIVIAMFVMDTIMMISEYIDANTRKVRDVLQLMNILHCYEIKAFRGGKRLRNSELIQYINSPVKDYQIKEGIFYIEIY